MDIFNYARSLEEETRIIATLVEEHTRAAADAEAEEMERAILRVIQARARAIALVSGLRHAAVVEAGEPLVMVEELPEGWRQTPEWLRDRQPDPSREEPA